MRKGALVLLISDASVSGVINYDEIWSGNISVTGDVEVEGG